MESGSLDSKIVTAEAEVFALADEWRELYGRVGNGLFTDYDWFVTWWQTMGALNGYMLHIITGRIGGRLVALLPLVVLPKKGFRMLKAAGAEAFYFCDMLCEDASQADALWSIARRSPHYDFAHMRDTSPASECERVLSSFAHRHDKNKSLILKLEWRSPQEWKATFSKQLRRNLDKALRLLEEKGPVRYEMCKNLPLPAGVIEGMVEHKTIWCKAFDKRGMFDQPNILSFYQRLATQTAKQGSLVLAWLKCGEAIIAYHMMFQHHKTIYSVVMATDAAWLKYSPGHLAHVNAISWAIENGYSEFNHMQGDYSYKYQFSNTVHECREYTFCRSLKGWVGEQLFVQRRMIRRRLFKEQV